MYNMLKVLSYAYVPSGLKTNKKSLNNRASIWVNIAGSIISGKDCEFLEVFKSL